MDQAQQQTAQQNLQAGQQAAQTQAQQDLENHEFFVPLKQIGSVQKNALAEATAMAKRKGDNFELVVNIQRFTPEEVKVYITGQSVVVQAGFPLQSQNILLSIPNHSLTAVEGASIYDVHINFGFLETLPPIFLLCPPQIWGISYPLSRFCSDVIY